MLPLHRARALPSALRSFRVETPTLIHADVFLSRLRTQGYELFVGVPCSYLTSLIDAAIASPEVAYIGATNEGDALAVACGAELAGLKSMVLFQNSGLGNAVNPLTSLTDTFRIPVLLLTTWRGDPLEAPDEPQHEVMGRITPRLLELLGVPWETLPDEEPELGPALERARTYMECERKPYALVAKKGAFSRGPGPARTGARGAGPARAAAAAGEDEDPGQREPAPSAARALQPVLAPDDVLAMVRSAVPDTDAVLATTGFTGRALYAQGDRPSHLYMVGSMGCLSSLALGVAKARPERRVVALDGDGAMLMRMGALATLAYERPPNLVHVLLDNGVHDSTGAQATVSPSVDLAAIASAAGYPRVLRVESLDELRAALLDRRPCLTFLHVRTSPRVDRKLPRPTIRPYEVAERFRAWIRG